MRICKKIDPVIDIVIIGFGNKSKMFIDIFLQKNELKGVNIIVICKDNFTFLNKYVQCIEVCKDCYIDIYQYCKERNILFINEKVKNIDSVNKIIYFTSDRNHLNYDFLLFDFDYKSSHLLNANFTHINVYPFKNKNLFFYYTHVIYLSLIKSQKNKIIDIDIYYKWKSFFLKNIVVEKFYNFYSYNDKYVDLIFDTYKLFDANTRSHDDNVLENTIFNSLKDNPLIDSIIEYDNKYTFKTSNRNKNCFNLILLSDNNDLGENLYHEIFENLNRISTSTNFLYIYINDLNIKKIDFCENYLIINKVIDVNKTDKEKTIKCMSINGKIITVNFDECINITNLQYPSYFYNSCYKIDDKSINKFCQYKNNDSLYFLNQIKNYDDLVICQTIYLNIFNKIHKNKCISIEEVKKKKSTNIKNCSNTINPFSSCAFNNILNYFYSKTLRIVKITLRRICINTFVQKKIELLNNKKNILENSLNDSKLKKRNNFPANLFIKIILYIYNKIALCFLLIKNKFTDENEKVSSCNSDNKNNGNSNLDVLPKYMYDFYKNEYEKRLIIKKKTEYKIIKKNDNNNVDNSFDENFIVIQNSSIDNTVINTLNTKKVNLYIKESIDKIINRNTCGGCGSKVPSNVLSNSLKSLDIFNSSNVYLGVEGCDDCCIFVHSKSKKSQNSPALVQTIDFFKSFIDDEYILGEIIAVHCLSDIYSMGGTGICALNVLIVKDNIEKKLQQRLENVLTGCCQKLKEEKCVLSGGHTCAGNENYVGLAVTGKIKKRKEKLTDHKKNIDNDKDQSNTYQNKKDVAVSINKEDKNNKNDNHNDHEENTWYINENLKIFKRHEELKSNYMFLPKGNRNIKSGDVIITTKMFGFGFIMAAHINKKAKARWIYNCLDEMLISNRKGGLYFLKNNIKACTDVTGFGILGHLNEMIKLSRREIYLNNKIYCEINENSYNDVKSNINEECKQVVKFNESDNSNMCNNFLGAKINLNNIIISEGVKECIENNIYSSMFKKNHYLCNNIINLDEALLNDKYGILFDPQTSGGLMAIVDKEKAEKILSDLKNLGYKNSSIIGEIINIQYEKFKNISFNQISLNDYLDTTNSIYIEC